MIFRRCLHTTAPAHKFVRLHWWPYFKRWQDLDQDAKKEAKEEEILTSFRPGNDMYLRPERREDALPKKPYADQTRRDSGGMPLELILDHTMLRYMDHTYDNKRRVKRYEHFQLLQYDQRFQPDRFMFLGADLAAAHFLMMRGCSFKFVGDDHWYTRGENIKKLPFSKVEGLYLEAIDASGSELMFEAFDNFYNLHHLRLLRLANCKYIDDWALSRIGAVFGSSLQFLDLSNCTRISGKGLMGLRSATGLRELRLDGLKNQKDICKSALLLEAAMPHLNITGLDFDKALDEIEIEERLLQDERTVIDAKGNVFIEDDDGELYYVDGKISEKAAVNDEDKPLVTSTIRRDLPNMDEIEFEQLDRLSNGRLRHQLIGSPSSYIWSDQVDVILSHEAKLNEKQKIPTDPKMLPSKARAERFKKLGIDVDKLLLERTKNLKLNAKEEILSIEEKKEATQGN